MDLKRLTKAKESAILAQYKKMCDNLPSHITKAEKAKIDAAFRMAFDAHAGATRSSKEPYITHPLNVAQIVVEELSLDADSIIAALLHDVVEDTPVPLEAIEKKFGKKVATIVSGVTKMNKKFSFYQSKQAENFRKLWRDIPNDVRIILVKLADRLDNMRAIRFLPKRKQLKIAAETKEIYAPIAHRMGLNKLKTELEDLYLKTCEPAIYHKIATQLQRKLKQREEDIAEFTKPIAKEMKKQKIPFRISMRPKSIYSIHKKMQKYNIAFDEIYDLFAIRIILATEQEKIACWQTFGIVTNLYTPNPARVKDWISTPRSNGYESLHTTVMGHKKEWVEVQIRTERMHKKAVRGFVSHWHYKGTKNAFTLEFEKWLKQVSKLVSEEPNSLKAMRNLKLGLYVEDINIFNEEGESITLPKGVCILDFALHALGEKGLYCDYGWVNKKEETLSYILKNGDQIQLHIGKEVTLTEEHLKYIATPQSADILQRFLLKSRKKCIEKGERILKTKLKKHTLPFVTEVIEQFREFLNEEIVEDLYYKIGKGNILDIENLIEKFTKSIANEGSDSELLDKKRNFFLSSNDTDCYERAPCCKPVPGEEIFGIKMANKKVKVHSVSCSKKDVILSSHGSRVIETNWYSSLDLFNTVFHIKSVFESTSRKQLLDITKSFNVESLMVERPKDGSIMFFVEIGVRNINDITEFMDRVKKVEGVQRIYRG